MKLITCCQFLVSFLKYIQSIPNHEVLMALFNSGGTISLMHKCVLLLEMVSLIGPIQNFTTQAGEF